MKTSIYPVYPIHADYQTDITQYITEQILLELELQYKNLLKKHNDELKALKKLYHIKKQKHAKEIDEKYQKIKMDGFIGMHRYKNKLDNELGILRHQHREEYYKIRELQKQEISKFKSTNDELLAKFKYAKLEYNYLLYNKKN